MGGTATYDSGDGWITMNGTMAEGGEYSVWAGADAATATFGLNIVELGVTDSPAENRVPPTKPITWTFDINVDLSGAGHDVQFDITQDDGANSGSATVTDGTPLVSDGPVEVTGETQTAPGTGGQYKNGLHLRARFDAVDSLGSVPQGTGFTVCAHPTNLTNSNKSNLSGRYGFRVDVTQDSDSATHTDLDQVLLHEVVDYPTVPNPPFTGTWSDFTEPALPGGVSGDSSGTDTHSCAYSGVSSPPSAGDFTADQDYEFHCKRCMTNPGSGANWVPLRSYTIKREVQQNGANWEFTTTKTGHGGPFTRTEPVQ